MSYTTEHAFMCEHPLCNGVGDHVCLPELLNRLANDIGFLQAVWDAHIESSEIEFVSDFEV